MKKILKWTLPFLFIIIISFSFISFTKIHNACESSSCRVIEEGEKGLIGQNAGSIVCTTECRRDLAEQNYLPVYLLVITDIIILGFWLKLIIQKQENFSSQ